jgi:site-specific DNA recombinase
VNAAVYARKSTEQKGVAEESKSIPRQVAGARAFIAKQDGWTLDEYSIYEDDGVSGALFANRAEFQRMMHDAAAGAFQALVFYDLDRFGRDGHKTMVALHELTDLGVTIWDFSTGVRVDLDSFEGEMMTFMKARVAQDFRVKIRKHTTTAMYDKAKQGLVTGGKTFGYDNEKIAKGQTKWRVNDAEAAVVREIYQRYADGEGARSIAGALNRSGVPTPRAQRGRASGWSATTVHDVLDRPLYRGQIVYGRSTKRYGRELGKRSLRRDGKVREKGQIKQPAESWIRLPENRDLRIIDADVAELVDARRLDHRTRYLASLAKGRAPERATGKYLLSGGMLICPTCDGHFEARKYPWRGNPGDVYMCSTRRRKPNVCTNNLALPIAHADETVLALIEDEILDPRYIEELLVLVGERAEADNSAELIHERDRLSTAIARLVGSIEDGVPSKTVAPVIKEREAALARIEAQLRTPRPTPPNIQRLRAALEQRTEQWKADLRGEPNVARLVIRRVVGPITLWEDTGTPEYCRWEADKKTDLLNGLPDVSAGLLAVLLMASPTGFEPVFWP